VNESISQTCLFFALLFLLLRFFGGSLLRRRLLGCKPRKHSEKVLHVGEALRNKVIRGRNSERGQRQNDGTNGTPAQYAKAMQTKPARTASSAGAACRLLGSRLGRRLLGLLLLLFRLL
jgi:hypothetical protein